MMDGQLRPNRITNKPLLARFEAVDRARFVPDAAKATAYVDAPIALPNGRELMSPLTLAHLLQALELQPTDSLLILAGNTGYSAAIAAPLVAQVTLVEDDKALLANAKKEVTAENITLVNAAPTHPPKGKKYAAILLDTVVDTLPATITDALTEGGKLAFIRQGRDGVYEAATLTRHGKTLMDETLFETGGTVHPAFQHHEGFVF